MNRTNKNAYTLIEILTTMAIILVLATATVCVIVRALKKSEEVVDVNDTRQGNIGTLIDVIEQGQGYDALPEHLKEGRFGE